MIWLKIFAVITLICSIAWFIVTPGFEPILAIIASLTTIISLFFIKKPEKTNKNPDKKADKQHQNISNSSFGIQAGGDVNIKIGDNKNDK